MSQAEPQIVALSDVYPACMNQDDLEERARQVRMMRDIYSNASEVLIWLGESDERTGNAIDVLTNRAKLEERGSISSAFEPPVSEFQMRELQVVDLITRHNYFTRL